MIILPYKNPPTFLCYHNKAFPFGIIEANIEKNITPWICSKCVNCSFNPKSPRNKFDIAIGDLWGVKENILTQQIIRVRKDLIASFNMDLLDFLKTALHNGCYIHGNYNEKYIPGKDSYEKEDYMHDFLIIGCNDDSFISMGYLANGRFQQFAIPNKNFIDSLLDNNGYILNINLFNYNKVIPPVPNTDKILKDLEKYIAFPQSNNKSNGISYGIQAMEELKNFFYQESLNSPQLYIDRRYSRALLEHKSMLVRLIDSFIDDKQKLFFLNYAEKNLMHAQTIHMLGIKVEYKKDREMINRITMLMEEIITSETKYLPILLEHMKNKANNN